MTTARRALLCVGAMLLGAVAGCETKPNRQPDLEGGHMDDTIIDNQKGEVRRLADAPSAQNVTRLLAFCGPQTHGVVRSEALHALWTTTRDALREPESERAKEILGAFESDAARACIIERLDDALESVRASAARLAGDLRIEGARDALVHLAKDDPSDSVRRHAAHAIAQLEQR